MESTTYQHQIPATFARNHHGKHYLSWSTHPFTMVFAWFSYGGGKYTTCYLVLKWPGVQSTRWEDANEGRSAYRVQQLSPESWVGRIDQILKLIYRYRMVYTRAYTLLSLSLCLLSPSVSLCLSLSISLSLSIYLSIHLSIYLSLSLSVCLLLTYILDLSSSFSLWLSENGGGYGPATNTRFLAGHLLLHIAAP